VIYWVKWVVKSGGGGGGWDVLFLVISTPIPLLYGLVVDMSMSTGALSLVVCG
jgi:hypothetical protein